MRNRNLIHPGEILQEEFLAPLGISQTRLAMDLHVPAPARLELERTDGEAYVTIPSISAWNGGYLTGL